MEGKMCMLGVYLYPLAFISLMNTCPFRSEKLKRYVLTVGNNTHFIQNSDHFIEPIYFYILISFTLPTVHNQSDWMTRKFGIALYSPPLLVSKYKPFLVLNVKQGHFI